MLCYTNVISTNPPVGGTVYGAQPAVMTGNSSVLPYVFPWCASARDNNVSATGPAGNKFTQATRTASTCYMVGLKESIEIQVTNGVPWQWRRVCFTAKAGANLGGALPNPTSTFSPAVETSSGVVRMVNGLTTLQQGVFFNYLLQGVQNTDYLDPMAAKLDAERFTIRYDKTITIACGNESGMIRKYNMYHPMGHNLVYDDDESGGTVQPSYFSADGKAGMGDFWVIDIFKPRLGAGPNDQLSFTPESTLYWHER